MRWRRIGLLADERHDRAQQPAVGEVGGRGDARQRAAQGRGQDHHRRGGEPEDRSASPHAAAIRPLTVRASRIPMSRPLITVPTTDPRSCSADSDELIGTTIWATTEVTPTTASARAQHREGGRDGRQHQRGGGHEHRAADQPAALVQVAERDQQRQPDHVAELADRDEQARGAVGDAEGAGQGVQQRLGVVEVGGRGPAGGRQQQHEAAADPAPELRVAGAGAARVVELRHLSLNIVRGAQTSRRRTCRQPLNAPEGGDACWAAPGATLGRGRTGHASRSPGRSSPSPTRP